MHNFLTYIDKNYIKKNVKIHIYIYIYILEKIVYSPCSTYSSLSEFDHKIEFPFIVYNIVISTFNYILNALEHLTLLYYCIIIIIIIIIQYLYSALYNIKITLSALH